MSRRSGSRRPTATLVRDRGGGERSAATGSRRRPFPLTEIFRGPESRKHTLPAFVLSLTTTLGWWAISSSLPAYAAQMARAGGAPNPEQWGLRVALLYTCGAVVAYLASGFLADGPGRRIYFFLTYLGALSATAATYLWTKSLEGLPWSSFINGFFTLSCAYSRMALYPAVLFTSSVRATAAAFIFNAARTIAWVFPILAGRLIHAFASIPRAAITLGSIDVAGLIVPWFLPETRGRALPQ